MYVPYYFYYVVVQNIKFKIMKFAVIAAGLGQRLADEGVEVSKPLVKIDGEMLVDRLMRIFTNCGASEIVVICNEIYDDVKQHLVKMREEYDLPLTIISKTTASSMHSLHEISRYLRKEPFCLTTVDTIFKENAFSNYVKAFEEMTAAGTADCLMGVTKFVDDEKPLYVDADGEGNITAFCDDKQQCRYVSGGIYGLNPRAMQTLDECIERGEKRMRNFQRALLKDGLKVKAYEFDKVIDVDHADDIKKAEDFLKE